MNTSMRGLVAALLVTVALPVAAAEASRYESKITNGGDASAGEYPYMVSVQLPELGHICGGSVIADEWVLTAAHCIDGSELEVLIGTVDLASGGERISVIDQLVHPDYDPRAGSDNDLALLRLAAPTSAPPVDLATSTAFEGAGTSATLTGWGGTNPDDPADETDGEQTQPQFLQEATFPIIDEDSCVEDLGELGYSPDLMLCAGSPDQNGTNGVDACFGDSGGPLVTLDGTRRVQVGVVSFGPGCAYYPSAYTQVSAYDDFIDEVLTTGALPVNEVDGQLDNTERVAGANRFATAAALASERFAPGVPAAFVVTGASFADALAAAPVAALFAGPVLLTTRDALPPETIAALDFLEPQQIVVVGGGGAVSPAVEAELQALTTGEVVRIAGEDRFRTSTVLSELGWDAGFGGIVVLASGESFADALSGAAYAASPEPSPLLLTGRDGLPAAVRAELERLQPGFVLVLGGTGVISDAVMAELAGLGVEADRVAGATRYETSALIASAFGVADEVIVATGANFPDGLVAGSLGLPLVLIPPGATIPDVAANAIDGLGASAGLVLGGTGAVSDAQALALDELVGG